MSARLTVCVPAYSQPEFLSDALESLCDQGLTRGEMVVCVSDDASPVRLEPVIDAFRDRLVIEHYRHDANIGHINNFAHAFQMARTEWVTFLPHDDVIAPGHLARSLAVLEREPDCHLAASLVICAPHPGALQIRHHGFFPGAPERARFGALYRWEPAEWMALALITTPMSIVGSVFRARVFRQCDEWRSFPLWHDRLMLAEMGRHGRVISLPWIGGYYRTGGNQLSGKLWSQHAKEFADTSKRVLEWCRASDIPVIDYWVNRICASDRRDRITYLQLLAAALPAAPFGKIKTAVERKLGTRVHVSRLERLGVPRRMAAAVRELNAFLGRRLG